MKAFAWWLEGVCRVLHFKFNVDREGNLRSTINLLKGESKSYQTLRDWWLKPLTMDDVILFLIIYRERFGPMDRCWYLMARRRKRRSSFQVYGCRARAFSKRQSYCFEVRAIPSLWMSRKSFSKRLSCAFWVRAFPSLSITGEWWLHMSFVYGKQTTFDGCDGVKEKNC